MGIPRAVSNAGYPGYDVIPDLRLLFQNGNGPLPLIEGKLF